MNETVRLSSSRTKPPRVYLAGKMKPKHDWRGPWSTLCRTPRAGVPYDDIYSNPKKAWLEHAFVVGPEPEDVVFELTGPFPASCDHGCAHGPLAIHMATTCSEDVTAETIRQVCLETILLSDLVCAHISTRDAYGTVAEIVWAVAHKIPVSLTFEAALLNEISRVSRGDVDGGEDFVGHHDLWFIEQLVRTAPVCAVTVVRDSAAARKHHAAFIRENWLRRRSR